MVIVSNAGSQLLVDAITAATKTAILELRQTRPRDHFYYFSLITTGTGNSPYLTAWSKEALEEVSVGCPDPDRARQELKWSYADSPFHLFGERYFSEVQGLVAVIASGKRDVYSVVIAAMEEAMRRLDGEGLFGRGEQRLGVVINAECMPPDGTNAERARRLNPPQALAEWWVEAAEVMQSTDP